MRWVLECDGPPDHPRLSGEVHCPEEVVRPTYDPERGVWAVLVARETTVRALARRWTFRVVEERDDPPEPPRPLPPADRRRTDRDVGTLVRGPMPDDPSHPSTLPGAEAWFAWRRRSDIVVPNRIDRGDLHARLRAPLAAGVAEIAAAAVDAGAWSAPEDRKVAVVFVVTGWCAWAEAAVAKALEEVSLVGEDARVVLVQNDPEAHAETRAWRPDPRHARRLRRVYSKNDGFAAACHAGARAAPKSAAWLLFTQADADWCRKDVRRATALARLFAAPPLGFGRPAVVGPSGGRVVDFRAGVVDELGRNVGPEAPPAVVDWIAGYWLLVHASVYADVGGWDPGFFLYWEDPDLSLRCALAGARPIAWPGLCVDHRRGTTIRARMPKAAILAVQEESRERFVARWGR